jgi:hypothetical protein
MQKNLLWQISHNILTTKTLLYNRKVTADSSCQVCQSANEDVEHRFFVCDINTETLNFLFLLVSALKLLSNNQQLLLLDLDFGLPPSLQRGTEILFSEGLYTLWTARNEITFQRRTHMQPPHERFSQSESKSG